MPSDFTIDQESFIVRANASGVVNIEDAFELMTAINQDPEYQKGMGTLLDLRNTRVMIKMDQLVTLAEAVRQLISVRGRIGIAILTDSDITYGMGRIVGSSLGQDGVQVNAFRDETEAVQWLREIAIGSGYWRRSTGTGD